MLPEFMEPGRHHVIVISRLRKWGEKYASEDLTRRLLRHRKPHELGSYAQSGATCFDDLLKICLPGFHKFSGRRFLSQVLLNDAGNVADLVFFMAA